MKQEYHSNACTNVHIRSEIQNSKITNSELSSRFFISTKTVRKWRKRLFTKDKSSCPVNIKRSFNLAQETLILSIRRTTWLPLEDIKIMVNCGEQTISKSAIYRLFCRNGVNVVPKVHREKVNKFKEYEPGYLHIDITYLPSIDGMRRYLFVAIDRATRYMFFKVYDNKTAENAQDFMNHCVDEFPFVLDYVLTDNGLEFTNHLIISKKRTACRKTSKFDEVCQKYKIKHRLTKPFTPKTNGMVERVNGTIKRATILVTKYMNMNELNDGLSSYLLHYNYYRRHGSLQRELNVKTPFDALCKWYELKPEIFIQNPFDFRRKKLLLYYYQKQVA